ncbi:hypothetical protein R1flu_022249 [Riccia fluitans]|uniref:Peptidase M3A/M3B catalytic domain-containing protein n=1 Tax=Riccia fluitans TaxID=41844 RepID=A0ABD1ZRM5_9MARC
MHSRRSAHRVLYKAAAVFGNYSRVESVGDAQHFSLLCGSSQGRSFPLIKRCFTSSAQSKILPGTRSGQDTKNGGKGLCKIQRRHLSEATSVLRREPVGLYGYGLLKSPYGFQAFAQEAIDRSEDIIKEIKELPPSMATIRAFDDISDVVCTVVDAAELCRSTHSDKDFVREANKASMKLYEYLQYLNSHPVLYKAVVDVEQSTALETEEAKRAAKTLRIDFERGGIHLPPEKLKRATELNLEITRLGREFTENVIYEQGQVDIFPASLIPNNLQTMMEPVTKSKSGMVGRYRVKKGNAGMISGLRMSTEPSVLFPVLKYVPDSEVRRKAFLVGNSVPKSNLRVLDHLICARHELAQLLGYNSYAEFALAPTMAEKPEAVLNFLVDLSDRIRGKADDELKMLGEFRKQLEDGIDGSIQAWDESYYSGLLKARTHDLTSTVVASYFPLTSCIEGLRVVSQSLFNATFEQVPMGPDEAWHPDVQKLTLRHATEGDLGHMYLDLYARPGKFPGCAHFTLKGCRRLTESEYQIPVVALVCNFSCPHASEAPVLNHWEVEALFHEFGHALHSLLSRTEYQHFSGTRTVLDFAETPSQLFEYYAWDYRVLSKFAKHYQTGDPIPQKMVASMNNAKRMLAATEIQRQVLFALIDQTFFGKQPLPGRDTTAVVADLKHRHTSMKHVDGTHWQTRFNHLINYGAGYYSYLYARCFAASIWHQHCQEDPLNLETGEKLRRGLLEFGGARDPAHMLQKLVGKDAVVASKSAGISPSPQHMLAGLGL